MQGILSIVRTALQCILWILSQSLWYLLNAICITGINHISVNGSLKWRFFCTKQMSEFKVMAFNYLCGWVSFQAVRGCRGISPELAEAVGRADSCSCIPSASPWPLICTNDGPSFLSAHASSASKQIHEKNPGKCSNLELCVLGYIPIPR